MFTLSKHCFLLYNTLQKGSVKMENRYASPNRKSTNVIYSCGHEKAEKLRSQGKSVVSLCAGEPDFNTPEGIKKATIEALNDNQTHYSSNRGYLGLRKKVAHLLKEQTTIDYDSDTEIIMTCGCSEAINNVCQAFINKDDEVIIFTQLLYLIKIQFYYVKEFL